MKTFSFWKAFFENMYLLKKSFFENIFFYVEKNFGKHFIFENIYILFKKKGFPFLKNRFFFFFYNFENAFRKQILFALKTVLENRFLF